MVSSSFSLSTNAIIRCRSVEIISFSASLNRSLARLARFSTIASFTSILNKNNWFCQTLGGIWIKGMFKTFLIFAPLCKKEQINR